MLKRSNISPKVRKAALYLVILLAGLTIGYLIWSEGDAEEEHVHEITTDDGGEMIWTCSMHPQVRQPEPGQCPICGMDLIPVATDDDAAVLEEADLPRLRVSERSAALMQIRTWPVERRLVDRQVDLYGRVDYDERGLKDVIVLADGQIEDLHVNFVNAPVSAGQPLAEIYSPAILTAGEELLLAHRSAERGGGEGLYRSARRQLQLRGVTDDQIDRMVDMGEVPRTYTVRSPMSGVVRELGGLEGDWLSSGGRLMALADLSQLWVQFEAYESDLTWLRAGQSVSFRAESIPGRQFTGNISFIEPIVGGDARTTRVRVEVGNPEGRLKPGMFVRGSVSAETDVDGAPIIIPASTPLITGRRAVVYVQIPGQDRPTFEGRTVELGPRAGDYYVVESGLEEGEIVVTNGNFKIDSELQIRGLPSMMAPEGGAPPAMHDHGPDDHFDIPDADHDHSIGIQMDMEPKEVDGNFGRQIRELMDAYVLIAHTLAHDDLYAVRASALDLRRAVEHISVDRIPGEGAESWSRVSAELERIATLVREADDLDEVRVELPVLTSIVENLATVFQSDEIGPIQEVYCPMAFDDEGATWLQRDAAIENPYFGQEMPRCGEIRRSL